eukprot:Rmarinus@m.3125
MGRGVTVFVPRSSAASHEVPHRHCGGGKNGPATSTVPAPHAYELEPPPPNFEEEVVPSLEAKTLSQPQENDTAGPGERAPWLEQYREAYAPWFGTDRMFFGAGGMPRSEGWALKQKRLKEAKQGRRVRQGHGGEGTQSTGAPAVKLSLPSPRDGSRQTRGGRAAKDGQEDGVAGGSGRREGRGVPDGILLAQDDGEGVTPGPAPSKGPPNARPGQHVGHFGVESTTTGRTLSRNNSTSPFASHDAQPALEVSSVQAASRLASDGGPCVDSRGHEGDSEEDEGPPLGDQLSSDGQNENKTPRLVRARSQPESAAVPAIDTADTTADITADTTPGTTPDTTLDTTPDATAGATALPADALGQEVPQHPSAVTPWGAEDDVLLRGPEIRVADDEVARSMAAGRHRSVNRNLTRSQSVVERRHSLHSTNRLRQRSVSASLEEPKMDYLQVPEVRRRRRHRSRSLSLSSSHTANFTVLPDPLLSEAPSSRAAEASANASASDSSATEPNTAADGDADSPIVVNAIDEIPAKLYKQTGTSALMHSTESPKSHAMSEVASLAISAASDTASSDDPSDVPDPPSTLREWGADHASMSLRDRVNRDRESDTLKRQETKEQRMSLRKERYRVSLRATPENTSLSSLSTIVLRGSRPKTAPVSKATATPTHTRHASTCEDAPFLSVLESDAPRHPRFDIHVTKATKRAGSTGASKKKLKRKSSAPQRSPQKGEWAGGEVGSISQLSQGTLHVELMRLKSFPRAVDTAPQRIFTQKPKQVRAAINKAVGRAAKVGSLTAAPAPLHTLESMLTYKDVLPESIEPEMLRRSTVFRETSFVSVASTDTVDSGESKSWSLNDLLKTSSGDSKTTGVAGGSRSHSLSVSPQISFEGRNREVFGSGGQPRGQSPHRTPLSQRQRIPVCFVTPPSPPKGHLSRRLSLSASAVHSELPIRPSSPILAKAGTEFGNYFASLPAKTRQKLLVSDEENKAIDERVQSFRKRNVKHEKSNQASLEILSSSTWNHAKEYAKIGEKALLGLRTSKQKRAEHGPMYYRLRRYFRAILLANVFVKYLCFTTAIKHGMDETLFQPKYQTYSSEGNAAPTAAEDEPGEESLFARIVREELFKRRVKSFRQKMRHGNSGAEKDEIAETSASDPPYPEPTCDGTGHETQQDQDGAQTGSTGLGGDEGDEGEDEKFSAALDRSIKLVRRKLKEKRITGILDIAAKVSKKVAHPTQTREPFDIHEPLRRKVIAICFKSPDARSDKDLAVLEHWSSTLGVQFFLCMTHSERPAKMNLLRNLHFRHIEKNHVLCRQGEVEEEFYIIMSGTVTVLMLRGGRQEIVRTMTAGQSFGEKALTHNLPRSATCLSTSPCDLLVLQKHSYERVMKRHHIDSVHQRLGLLEEQQFLSHHTRANMIRIAQSLQEQFYKMNDVLFRAGQEATHFYFVVRGAVTLMTDCSERGEEAGLRTASHDRPSSAQPLSKQLGRELVQVAIVYPPDLIADWQDFEHLGKGLTERTPYHTVTAVASEEETIVYTLSRQDAFTLLSPFTYPRLEEYVSSRQSHRQLLALDASAIRRYSRQGSIARNGRSTSAKQSWEAKRASRVSRRAASADSAGENDSEMGGAMEEPVVDPEVGSGVSRGVDGDPGGQPSEAPRQRETFRPSSPTPLEHKLAREGKMSVGVTPVVVPPSRLAAYQKVQASANAPPNGAVSEKKPEACSKPQPHSSKKSPNDSSGAAGSCGGSDSGSGDSGEESGGRAWVNEDGQWFPAALKDRFKARPVSASGCVIPPHTVYALEMPFRPSSAGGVYPGFNGGFSTGRHSVLYDDAEAYYDDYDDPFRCHDDEDGGGGAGGGAGGARLSVSPPRGSPKQHPRPATAPLRVPHPATETADPVARMVDGSPRSTTSTAAVSPGRGGTQSQNARVSSQRRARSATMPRTSLSLPPDAAPVIKVSPVADAAQPATLSIANLERAYPQNRPRSRSSLLVPDNHGGSATPADSHRSSITRKERCHSLLRGRGSVVSQDPSDATLLSARTDDHRDHDHDHVASGSSAVAAIATIKAVGKLRRRRVMSTSSVGSNEDLASLLNARTDNGQDPWLACLQREQAKEENVHTTAVSLKCVPAAAYTGNCGYFGV